LKVTQALGFRLGAIQFNYAADRIGMEIANQLFQLIERDWKDSIVHWIQSA